MRISTMNVEHGSDKVLILAHKNDDWELIQVHAIIRPFTTIHV